MRNNKRNTMRRYLRKFGQWAAACGLLLGAVATHELRAENDPSRIRRTEAERSILEFLQAVPAPDRERYRRAIDNELEKIKRGRFRQLRLTEETASRGEVEQKVRQRLAAFREKNEERLRREAADAARKRFFPWCDEWIELKLTNGDTCFGYMKHTDYKTFLVLHRRIDRLDANKGTFTTKWSGELRLEKEQLTAESQSCFGSEEIRREAMKRYLATYLKKYLDDTYQKMAKQYREELCRTHRYRKVDGRYYTRDEYYALDYLVDDVSRVLATNRKKLDKELVAAEKARKRAEAEARKRAEEERKRAEEARRRAEEEARQRAEEKRREEERQKNIKIAQEYWSQVVNEFAVTAKPFLAPTEKLTLQRLEEFGNSSQALPDKILRRLVDHSQKAYFIQKHLTLSPLQERFLKSINRASTHAESADSYLDMARKLQQDGIHDSSQAAINVAEAELKVAKAAFMQAVWDFFKLI